MNKVIDKGFRSCHFVSTIVKHPVCSIEKQCMCLVMLVSLVDWTVVLRIHYSIFYSLQNFLTVIQQNTDKHFISCFRLCVRQTASTVSTC